MDHEIEEAYKHLDYAMDHLKNAKPNDRSDKDRKFAIVMTQLEMLQAIVAMFLMATEDTEDI